MVIVRKKPLLQDYAKKAAKIKSRAKGRKVIVLVFLLTLLVPAFFFSKEKISTWVDKLNTPTKYFFIKPEGDTDSEVFNPIVFKGKKDKEELVEKLSLLIDSLQGKYGIYFYDFGDEIEVSINGDQVFDAASVVKIVPMVLYYQQVMAGENSLEKIYSLRGSDVQSYGTGSMQYQPLGTEYTYAELLELSGKESDNTADYVLRQELGEDSLQSFLNELKLTQTSLTNVKSTPQDIGIFFRLLYENDLLDQKHKNMLYDNLSDTIFEDRLSAGVPEAIRVVHKIGNGFNRSYNDCGIIFTPDPFVLCIMSEDASESEAMSVIPQLTEAVFLWSNYIK
jgi:beta-lactamase class A